METEEQNTAKPSPSLRDLILEKLHEKGVTTVTIAFDGACDEGQVESVTCTTSDGGQGSLDWPCEIPGKLRALGHPSESNVAGQSEDPIASRPMTMKELVEEWTYD